MDVAAPARAPRLALEDVAFAYGRTPVLGGVSLHVAPGERVALLGRNGAGKSTLLRVASGYLTAQRGRVLLDGQDLRALPRRVAARRVGGTAAGESAELPFRVREAVALGRHPWRGAFGPPSAADDDAVQAALAAADLVPLAERVLPSLSSGERQRVALARALAQQADLLLLDEPTAHLDLGHQTRLLNVVSAAAARGTAVLAALHDLNVAAAWADRLVLLHRGRVLAAGPPDHVLTPDLVRAAFDAEVVRVQVAGRAAPLVLPAGGRP